MITFGKYKNHELDSLLGKDDSYIHFLCGIKDLDESLAEQMEVLLPQTKIQNGKYKGLTIDWIRKNDLGYYNWIKRNYNDKFVSYLKLSE